MDFDFCCMESYDDEQDWPGTSDTNSTDTNEALNDALSVEHADIYHSMNVMLDQERPGEETGEEDREIVGFCLQVNVQGVLYLLLEVDFLLLLRVWAMIPMRPCALTFS